MTLILTGATLAALAASAAAAAARPAATLTIRHEAIGCHSWSLNGGRYGVSQTVQLRVGDWLRVVNRDANVHRLVQMSGGELVYDAASSARRASLSVFRLPPDPRGGAGAATGVMDSWGASALVSFSDSGVYTLGTIEGAAFAGASAGSRGADNALTLRVVVVPQRPQPPG